MTLIAELCGEHRALEEHAARLMRAVACEVPDAASVAGARWQMAQVLFDHCRREDRGVYDRLLASGDASATAVAWRYRQDHGAIVADFSRYIADWPVGRIAREWARFRVETEALVASLALRIAQEEAVLYTHAERVMAQRAAA